MVNAAQLTAALLEDEPPLAHGCSVCKRIRQPDGSYVAQDLGHSNISHGMCPDCTPKFRQQARSIKLDKPAFRLR